MKSIAIKDLSENFFEVIGKEWMLVTAGSKEHFNTMTASFFTPFKSRWGFPPPYV